MARPQPIIVPGPSGFGLDKKSFEAKVDLRPLFELFRQKEKQQAEAAKQEAMTNVLAQFLFPPQTITATPPTPEPRALDDVAGGIGEPVSAGFQFAPVTTTTTPTTEQKSFINALLRTAPKELGTAIVKQMLPEPEKVEAFKPPSFVNTEYARAMASVGLNPNDPAAYTAENLAEADAVLVGREKKEDKIQKRDVRNITMGENEATVIETSPGSGEYEMLVIGGMPATGRKRAGVEITLGEPASAGERTAIAETRATIGLMDNIKGLFDETFVGPITGRVGSVKNIFGANTKQQSDFIAASSALKNTIIKSVTGAQMSEAESKRILKQVPNENDAPEVWLSKWEQTNRNLEELNKRRLEVIKQSGLRVPEGGGAPTGAPRTAEDFLNKYKLQVK